MSAIGRLAFELQEQAEELGFASVIEATDNGYIVDYNKKILVKASDKELELAQLEWEKEKIDKRIDELKGELK